MISIFISVLLVAVVKLGFLWLFAPKNQRYRHGLESLPQKDNGASLVENHDGQDIGSPLRFGLEASERLAIRHTERMVYAVLSQEQLTGER